MQSKKVLIVDDEENIRKLLSRILTEAGYQIVGEAYDGDEAMELYRLNKPDVVLLDIRMPRFDGITGLKNILEHDPKAKIVMITCVDDRKVIVEAIKTGAWDYITKPFEEEEVLATLEKALMDSERKKK